jgi:hypothetical protein
MPIITLRIQLGKLLQEIIMAYFAISRDHISVVRFVKDLMLTDGVQKARKSAIHEG